MVGLPLDEDPFYDSSYDEDTDYVAPKVQTYDGDMESPNDMIVDPDDYVGQEDLDEKDDVAIINPDDADLVDRPRADDSMSMRQPLSN